MNENMKEGIRLYNSKRFEKALEEFLEINENPSENIELAYYLGLCYTKLEKYDEALLYLEQVVTNESNVIYIYQSRMVLSYIYAISGRYKLAEFEVNELIESGFASPQVWATAGYVQYAQGEVEKGLELLQKAVSLDPDNSNALNSMGFIMAEEGIDPLGAVSYCKKAISKAPENPAYLDSLGWAYYKSGKMNEARMYLRKALDLCSGNKIIAGHLKTIMKSM